MTGHLKELLYGRNGKYILSVELDGDFGEQFDELNGKLCDVEIKLHKEKRSLNANAYFHCLVNKISQRLGDKEDSVKTKLVLEYGALMRDKNGVAVGFKLPADVDASSIYKYVKWYNKCTEQTAKGEMDFNYFLVYKETHLMDTAEMSKLIDGTISEAKDLGIQTDTPQEIERLKERWNNGK